MLSNSKSIVQNSQRFLQVPISPKQDGFINSSPLAALVCSLDGGTFPPSLSIGSSAQSLLHNEGQMGSNYPLHLQNELFFSEVLGEGNSQAPIYFDWVKRSLQLIDRATKTNGCLPFQSIHAVGNAMQFLDAKVVGNMIGQPPDVLHKYFGCDHRHPYRKITLCRTQISVELENTIANFLFEKFLVVYSYIDSHGKRCSTTTPIHSHPFNHEVTYFLSGGPQAEIIEEEFAITDDQELPLLSNDGLFNPKIRRSLEKGALQNIRVHSINSYRRPFHFQPLILQNFESDPKLAKTELILLTDGFFRPHRVTVIDDPDSSSETLYYAINNYWSPTGRVFLYNEDSTTTWNCRDWQHE